MNELTTLQWSIDEDLHYYRRAGFGAIGVWRRKLVDYGIERSVELLADSGLAVSNLMWAGGFTGSDGRSLEEAVADATEAIELAEMIGAGCLLLHTGGRNYHTHRHANRLIRSALEDLLPVAEARGVTLAIEPMHAACASEWTLLTTLDAAITLLDEYRCEALQLAFDTYHFPDADTDQLATIADRTAIVHLADIANPHSIDQERCLMGEGRAPLAEIVRTLVLNGFEGCFDIKLIGTPGGVLAYESLVQQSATRGEKLLAAAIELTPSAF